MSKNKKKGNPFEDHLWDDEQLLWTGQAQMSWWEYSDLESPQDTIQKLSDTNPAKEESVGCGFWLAVVLSLVISLNSITNIYQALSPMLVSSSVVLQLFAQIAIFLAFWILWFVITFVLLYCAIRPLSILAVKLTDKLLSKGSLPAIQYGITNYRLFVLSESETRHLMHYDITGTRLENGTFGTIITWDHQDSSQNEFPPFIGLNDFDVQEVLRLVEENHHGKGFTVDDFREKKKIQPRDVEEQRSRHKKCYNDIITA